MRLLSTTSVMARLDISSKETIRQMVKNQKLPPPIRSEKGGRNKWLESEIDGYIESLAANRQRPQQQQAAA